MRMSRTFAHAVLVAGLLAASVATSRAAEDPTSLRGACVAKGPLIVTETNEVRFSAEGMCGALPVSVFDFLGPFQYSFPQWTGGCGYGPGPFPRLRIQISSQTDPTGTLGRSRATFWYFPDLVVGADRIRAPNSTTRVVIRDIVADQYGRPTAAGPIVGHGVLLTRLGGSCDVTDPRKATASVVFVLHGQLSL